jgi:hypothetical protein
MRAGLSLSGGKASATPLQRGAGLLTPVRPRQALIVEPAGRHRMVRTVAAPWIRRLPMGETSTGDEREQAPGKDRPQPKPDDRDAADIIEGDIGEARLREPGDGETGADLDKLKDVVDVQTKQEEGQG